MFVTVEYDNTYYWVGRKYWDSSSPYDKLVILSKVDGFYHDITSTMHGPVTLRGLSDVYYFKPIDMPHPDIIDPE